MTNQNKEKEMKLEVTGKPLSYEGAVLNALSEAKNQNKVIIKLGLPIKVQREIMKDTPMPKSTSLKSLFGIKVERSKSMQITTEFYRIKFR